MKDIFILLPCLIQHILLFLHAGLCDSVTCTSPPTCRSSGSCNPSSGLCVVRESIHYLMYDEIYRSSSMSYVSWAARWAVRCSFIAIFSFLMIFTSTLLLRMVWPATMVMQPHRTTSVWQEHAKAQVYTLDLIVFWLLIMWGPVLLCGFWCIMISLVFLLFFDDSSKRPLDDHRGWKPCLWHPVR